MSRQLSWSLMILWIFSVSVFSVESAGVKNGEPPARNGWQPVMNYDNVRNVSPPSNYAVYTVSHFDSERQPNYKPSQQHRKSVDTIHQYDYTPPSILGSFSIFGHSIPKNRDENESKSQRESGINTNEYDFLVPPPRQKIEPYQKIKINGDGYGGPSHYRDIYTPMNTQFTFIPTGAASSVVKKHPGGVPSRDEQGHHHPLRQYPTAGESHRPPHPKLPAWMQNVRDNIDPYHVNTFKQYPVHQEGIVDGGNRLYTQIGHPPVFKSPYDVKNPSKPVIENYHDYVTHHPGNPYAVQPSSSQRNEFTPFITSNTRHIEPHYGFDHNSVGKQKLEASHLHTDSAVDNYYDTRKKNTTTNWSISSSKNQFSELLPKLNKPVQFNRPNNAIPHQTYVQENNRLKSQIIPEKILPSVPKIRQETPESISLKHFNEQQYLLQQQLLERDRQKLEQLQTQYTSSTRKPTDKHKERESTSVESNFDHEFQVYEAVKLTNEEKLSPERRPSTTRIKENYSTKHVYELPTKESFTFDYSPEQVTHKPTEVNPLTGKKKKGNHQRIIVESGINNYDRETIHNSKTQTQIQPENMLNNFSQLGITTTPEFITETRPSFASSSGTITRTSQASTNTQSQGSTTPTSEPARTMPLITDTTTKKPTITKIRSQSRGPTRRRRPVLEPEPTSSSTSSIQPTLSSTRDTTESYPVTEQSSTSADDFQEYRNENRYSTPEQEDKGNTVISEELITLVTLGQRETTDGRNSFSTKSPTTQYDHIESTPSSTHEMINLPEETTTKTTERTHSTTRDYSYSIAPLEYLFNFTEINGGDETSTQASEWISSVHKKIENEFSNSPEPVEVTTRPTYRLRPMKMANNTRPRFSVKDYKSRLDYRNRMSQTSTTESSSVTTVSIKSKGTGKYKYTPRHSYTKAKSSTPNYSTKNANATDVVEGKRTKISGHRPFTGGFHRNRGVNNTTEMSNSDDKTQVNTPVKENKFIQPIRRRPQLKTSAQLAQMIKKNKNHSESPERTTKEPVSSITKPIQIKSEFLSEESPATSTSTTSDMIKIKSKDALEDINMDSPDNNDKKKEKIIEEPAESTTAEIVKNSFQHSSIQSDEEAFARASLSVADLTSSASALYNKPGMFKALSAMPVFDSDTHKKALTPPMDEPSLPIEAFFREISNRE